ncbi:MAG: hypothetical protein IPL48_16130 [Bacteroidetes bacterium]|nr:hypothetical protein [Bacteroidota bacterium]
MQSIAPAFSFIYREEIIPNFGFRTNLTYTILRGNDALFRKKMNRGMNAT